MGSTAMNTGTVLSAAAKVYGGARQGAALDAAGGQLSMEGGQAIASGIQGAQAARLRGAYVASNARGLTAASGLTTTGTSAIANEGRIQGQAEYDALSSIYSGESKAQDLEFRAADLRSEGSATRTAGWLSGISTIFSAQAGQPKPQTWSEKYNGS
ncbi:MAG: hypothetical protein ACREVO_08120 [Steroidobacteraceae bacterium]